MPQDIKTIPINELRDDLAASLGDIRVCELALLHKIDTYSGGDSTQRRLDVNKAIVEMINERLISLDVEDET